MSRPVIVLEFNELSPTLMDRFIAQGHLPGFKALRDQSLVQVTDAGEQSPNLEPWIQWVTFHTGLPFSTHKVFDLGDAHKFKAPRIWDLVLEAGKSVWVCGSMNATIQKPNDKTWFIPDPWAAEVNPYPKGEFDLFFGLVAKYVQDHARETAPWSKKDYLNFMIYMLTHGLSIKTMWLAGKQIVQDKLNKELRWKRATILDRLQWDLFRHYWTARRPDFSTFFINSTAHFQHFHWRDMEPEHFTANNVPLSPYARDAILTGYKSMDALVQDALKMAPDAIILLVTALSQQPLLKYESVGGKCILKPINPDALMKFAGVTQNYRYAPVMSEEFRIYFDSEADAMAAESKLKGMTVNGQQLLRVIRTKDEIYGGCDIINMPTSDTLIRTSSSNQTVPFVSMFYQAEGAKSGGHHPDGIFWIRTPGQAGKVVPGKLPLTDAAQQLADIMGVRLNDDLMQKSAA